MQSREKFYLSKILEKHLCADFMYYCNKNLFSAFSEISGIAFWKYVYDSLVIFQNILKSTRS